MSGNKTNQDIFLKDAEFMDFMVTEMLEDPSLGIAFIFVELFRGNRDAIETCDAKIFEAFGSRLDQAFEPSNRGAAAVDPRRFLNFFEVMIEIQALV